MCDHGSDVWLWKWCMITEVVCDHAGDVCSWRWCVTTEVVWDHAGDVWSWKWCMTTEVVCDHAGDVWSWRLYVIWQMTHHHGSHVCYWSGVFLITQCVITVDVWSLVMHYHCCDKLLLWLWLLKRNMIREVMYGHWSEVWSLKWWHIIIKVTFGPWSGPLQLK